MAHHNYLIGHNTSPNGTNQILTPNRPHAPDPTREALVTRESYFVCSSFMVSWESFHCSVFSLLQQGHSLTVVVNRLISAPVLPISAEAPQRLRNHGAKQYPDNG